MKRIIIIFISVFIVSCASLKGNKVISDSLKLSKCKSSGVLLRISKNSYLQKDVNFKNMSFWTEGYKKINNFFFLKETSNELGFYSSEFDRFYQLSINKKYLQYKSLGVIRLYLRHNEEEIRRIMSDNNLDSLIIYEFDGSYSGELQFIDFDSMIIIIDSDLNIAYLDHQAAGYNVQEVDTTRVKKHLLDKISERFLKKMISLNFMEEE